MTVPLVFFNINLKRLKYEQLSNNQSTFTIEK